jgi:hypothetical protein
VNGDDTAQRSPDRPGGEPIAPAEYSPPRDAAPWRIGSLCTGYGGLDLAVDAILGTRLAWYAEVDRHANAVLAARFPNVANLGDIRNVDWTGSNRSTSSPPDSRAGLFRVIGYPDCWSPDARRRPHPEPAGGQGHGCGVAPVADLAEANATV